MEIKFLKTNGVEIQTANNSDRISIIQQLVVNKTGGENETGADGKSAYEIAVENGFVGTELEWLESLKGEPGQSGTNGVDGTNGVQGEKGDKGETGEKGQQGEQGSQGVPGEKGEKGDSGIIAQADWNATEAPAAIKNKPSEFQPSSHNHDELYASKTTKWVTISATYSGVQEFTLAGTQQLAYEMIGTLFTCTNSAGDTRRIGYITNAVYNAGTITVTVTTNTDLSDTDISYKFTPRIYFHYFAHATQCVNELIADANSQVGIWFANTKFDSYLLNVDASVLSPASGAGAAVVFNVYKNATALFSSAPDLGTNSILVNQRPTTKEISATENVSIRITSVGGTTKASNFQARLTIVPQSIYLSAGV